MGVSIDGGREGGREVYVCHGSVALVVCRLADILPRTRRRAACYEGRKSVMCRGRSRQNEGTEELHCVFKWIPICSRCIQTLLVVGGSLSVLGKRAAPYIYLFQCPLFFLGTGLRTSTVCFHA